MSPDFEQKLMELMEEARERNLSSVHVVLHMLLGSHTCGMQAEFAKYCCGFSAFPNALQFGGTTTVRDDFPSELDMGN
jgi:hypothetical protein